MSDRMLRLPVRHFQIAQLYGPGMPPSGREGYHVGAVEKPVGQVGLVLVHCWNLGEADGPYPFKPGVRIPGQAGNWVPAARQVVRDRIAPALRAARRAGVPVFHLAQAGYASRYDGYRKVQADPAMREPARDAVEGCVRPRTGQDQLAAEYGPDFPGCVWDTHAETFGIASDLKPAGTDAVVVNGWQLNRLCREGDIDTLVYAGFMADICLINSSGAIREMANRYRYNCVVLRECTVAYEYPETVEGRWMTFAAIRLMETEFGCSASADDFIAAAKATAGA